MGVRRDEVMLRPRGVGGAEGPAALEFIPSTPTPHL